MMVLDKELPGRVLSSLTPLLLCFAGIFLLVLPVRPFGGMLPVPVVPLMVVFFWSVYHPPLMPASAIFLTGIVQDLVTGAPVGLWAVIYLVTRLVALSQRSYFIGRTHKVVVAGFAFVAAIAGFIQWSVTSLLHGVFLPVVFPVLQMSVTVVCYPLAAYVFIRLHRRILMES